MNTVIDKILNGHRKSAVEFDTSGLIDECESVKLEILRPEYTCGECGRNDGMRVRVIDLYTLNGKVVFKAVKTVFCPHCGNNKILPQ